MSDEWLNGARRGIDAGWEDASFADSYGGKTDASRAFSERCGLTQAEAEHTDFHSGFLTGYAEGVERFENDL